MSDGVDMTGHRLREQLRVRKLPRSQVVVQPVGIAHRGHDTIEVRKSKGARLVTGEVNGSNVIAMSERQRTAIKNRMIIIEQRSICRGH